PAVLLFDSASISCFFYALEKKRGAKKHVIRLLAEDSAPFMDPVEMRERARAFYASLFSVDPTDSNDCRVLCNDLLTASPTTGWSCLSLWLSSGKPTNKSPGMDRLTVEFYGLFWDILGLDLVIDWAEPLGSGFPLSVVQVL
ncbi:unnamed protein product, partial [Lepidochelys kempii]